MQPGQRTVAGELLGALAVVLRLPITQLSLVVAGRTDAGVHAIGQVCHVDVDGAALPGVGGVDLDRLARRLRGLLPADIRVRTVLLAPPGFDARFSAVRRHYRYVLTDDEAGVAPLERAFVVAHPRPLDVAAMAAASQPLLGLHDFAAFCRRRDAPAGTVTTIRTLLRFDWRREDNGRVVAEVSADAFCRSMVRALVGCLLVVGDGRRPGDWPAAVLAAGARDPAASVGPAHGLSLVGVDYPADAELAERAVLARALRRLPPS